MARAVYQGSSSRVTRATQVPHFAQQTGLRGTLAHVLCLTRSASPRLSHGVFGLDVWLALVLGLVKTWDAESVCRLWKDGGILKSRRRDFVRPIFPSA